MADAKNYFTELNSVDVSDKIEKKNGLSYLSWAWAWGELKKRHPDANYKVYENENGWNYFTDGKTCWVKTGVTVNGVEHIEYLPVMDFKNKSIPLNAITSFEVNKTIQRSLTKAVARHGLGLYIYAGEDLPETGDGEPVAVVEPAKPVKKAPAKKTVAETAPTKPTADIPEMSKDEARQMFIDYCSANGVNIRDVGHMCNLNKNSTADDFMDALALAQGMATGSINKEANA
jgi:hypothetical protein